MAEWLQAPYGLLERIIEARQYANVKAAFDAANSKEKRDALPDGGVFALCRRIRFELVKEEKAARAAKKKK